MAGLGLLSLEMVLEYASRIKCEYLNIKANPGLSYDRPENYTKVLDKIKSSSRRFEFKEVEGSHHVHLNEPEKVAPCIFDFMKTWKPEDVAVAPAVNGSTSTT